MESLHINNKEEMPFNHYVAQLKEADPYEISKRLCIPYDEETGELTIQFLGAEYHIAVSEFSIRSDSERAFAVNNKKMQTFIIRYLTNGSLIAPQGRYLSFQQMPWGDVYINPYTGRVINRISFTYGTRPDAFSSVMKKMGATEIKMGDVAFEITVTADFSIRIILWKADEEFPPSTQVLYSDNFLAFSAEDRVEICDIIVNSMKFTEQLLEEK